MRYVIHAPNVHQGGGRTLLLALLEELRALGADCVAVLDERLKLPIEFARGIYVLRAKPTVTGRFFAEWKLATISQPGDIVLCFGNLPPLLWNHANVCVFLQNRYLISRYGTRGFSFRQRCRIEIERLWLRFCLPSEALLLVQSESMAKDVASVFGSRSVEIAPFAPKQSTMAPAELLSPKKYDFLYVASGEPHKNHRNLLEAWELLSSEGLFPTLALTVDSNQYPQLSGWIDLRVSSSGLKIRNLGHLSACDITTLYAESGALIYPSLFESYGLPLLEATSFGLPIIASELDYVRDVSDPVFSFDPTSAVSIARAVKRYLGRKTGLRTMTPGEFLDRIQNLISAYKL